MTTDSTLQLTPQLAPQFDTANLDLNFKKGESAQFSVTVADYDLDLRGCLIFAEIRKLSPGYNLLQGFTGIITQGSDTILLRQYPTTHDRFQALSACGIRAGDLITLEGSGITASKVLAVTDTALVCSTPATRSISEGRLFLRSLSSASFTAVPISTFGEIAANVTAGTVTVSSSPATVPAGNTLMFRKADGTAQPFVLSQDLIVGGTVISGAGTVTSGAIAKVGVQTIIVNQQMAVNATSITVSPLFMGIEARALLNFAIRTSDGWQYVGKAITSSAVAHSVPASPITSIPVEALTSAIPKNAIAWHGNTPFNSFYLAIDPADTHFLESGLYGYDVICRKPDGYTIRLIQGKVSLSDHWSDL
jgi:hypothetical protein